MALGPKDWWGALGYKDPFILASSRPRFLKDLAVFTAKKVFHVFSFKPNVKLEDIFAYIEAQHTGVLKHIILCFLIVKKDTDMSTVKKLVCVFHRTLSHDDVNTKINVSNKCIYSLFIAKMRENRVQNVMSCSQQLLSAMLIVLLLLLKPGYVRS